MISSGSVVLMLILFLSFKNNMAVRTLITEPAGLSVNVFFSYCGMSFIALLGITAGVKVLTDTFVLY